MGVYLWKEKLPSVYQEVEWIGSSRTQVINTGVIPTTQTYTAELEVESTESGSEYWAFGIWGTTGFRGGQDNSGHWDTSFGASYEPSSYSLNTKTKITMSNSGKGTSTDTAIGLFGMGENGAYASNRKGAYKIYYCKIWDSGTLIRDFVPCYRKSDDEIGMYDLVNNQFYTNSGSGTFTKGQDINYVGHELQNAYIGEYHEIIICDFTQSDQGFSIAEAHSTNNGRDSNGFYIKSTQSWGAGARLLIPSTITSVGTPKMIKLYGKNMNVGSGVGISEGIDSKNIRVFGNQIQTTNTRGTPANTSVSPLNEDVFAIDFENEICYLESSPSITATIYPSTVLTLWNNGTLNLSVLSPNENYYGYLQKAEFYF